MSPIHLHHYSLLPGGETQGRKKFRLKAQKPKASWLSTHKVTLLLASSSQTGRRVPLYLSSLLTWSHCVALAGPELRDRQPRSPKCWH